MSGVIQVDRFTRQKQSISGNFRPGDLPRLAEYLAGDGGEIVWRLEGSVATDRMGSQKRCIKCIISGWFLLAEPATLKPLRYELDIDSNLVLMASEEELPPLEMESDDEDFILCGSELDVVERIEEEILLDLPAAFGGQISAPGKVPSVPSAASAKSPDTAHRGAAGGKISPFAKLAELKKK